MRLLYVLLALLSTAVSVHAQSYQPNLSLSSNSPVCDGQTFQINAARSIPPGGTSLSFRWSGPNSFTSNAFAALQVTASAATAGVYSLTMTYSGTTNGTATASTTVALGTPKPDAYISYISSEGYTVSSSSYQICSPTSLSLIANPDRAGSNNPATYRWSGPGGYSSTERNPVVVQGVAGLYIVEATYPNGCGTGRDTVTISSFTPSVFFGTYLTGPNQPFTSSFCPGSAAEFRASTSTVPAGTTTSYQWRGPNGFTSTAQNFTLTNLTTAMAGSYSVVATFSGTCSATATRSQSIQISTAPTVYISLSTPGPNVEYNTAFCTGSAARLSASVSGGTATYRWSGPNGFASTAQSFTLSGLTPAMAGTYSVTATISGSCSGTSSASSTLSLSRPSLSLGTRVTQGYGFDNQFCTGSVAVVQTYSNAPVGSAITYNWRGPNGFASSAASLTLANISTATAGLYSVTATFGGQCTGQRVAFVNIRTGTPTVAVALETSDGAGTTGSIPLCSGKTYRLRPIDNNFLTPPVGNTYFWTRPDGTTSTSDNIVIASASASDVGLYTLKTSFGGVCSGTTVTTKTIKVGISPTIIQATRALIASGQSTVLYCKSCSYVSTVWSDGQRGQSISVSPAQTTVYTAVYGNGDGCLSPPSNALTIQVSNQPAVSQQLTVQLSNRVPDIGQPVTVTLTVVNSSSNTAGNVRVRCRLPDGLNVVSGGTMQVDGSVLTGLLPAVGAGAAGSLTFTVTPTVAGVFRLAAQITEADNPDLDSDYANSTDVGQKATARADFRTQSPGSIIVESPEPNPTDLPYAEPTLVIPDGSDIDLSLGLAASSLTPNLNDVITITAQIEKTGYTEILSPALTCVLPQGLTFVDGDGWSATGQTIVFAGGNVFSDQQYSQPTVQTFSFRVRATGPVNGSINAQISYCDWDDVDSTPNNGYDTGEDDTAQISLRGQ